MFIVADATILITISDSRNREWITNKLALRFTVARIYTRTYTRVKITRCKINVRVYL